MKDAKGHGSDARGGDGGVPVGAQAGKAVRDMIVGSADRAQKIADWRDKGTSDAQAREGIRALFNLPSRE